MRKFSILAAWALAALTMMSQGFATHYSRHCLKQQEVYNATTTIHVGAAVEPTIAVNPKNTNNIVTCWQQDRISNAGALEAGIAYSKDGGKTWKNSTVPFQICNGGISQRVTDTWLSFSKDGSRVYLIAIFINAKTERNTQNQQGVVVTVSKDGGAHWGKPYFLASSQESLNEPTGLFALDDKTSITADPNYSDLAYAVWDRFDQAISFHSHTEISRTKNGGKTWTPHKVLYDPFPDLIAHNHSNGILNDNSTVNNIVVVLPKGKKPHMNGDLLNFMVRIFAKPGVTDAQYTNDIFPYQHTKFDIAFVRSKNQGKTWEKHAHVVHPLDGNLVFTGGYTYKHGHISGGIGALIRAGDIIPAFCVNPANGFLYAVWQTGHFRDDKLPQIAISSSRDGGQTWSKPVRISRTPKHAKNPQAFSPFVAITEDGQLGVLYFDLRNDNKAHINKTKIDAWLAVYNEVEKQNGGSTKAGLNFVKELRLSKKSYIVQHGPTTTQGNMVDGDYPFLVAQKSKLYAIYTKSFNGPFKKPERLLFDREHHAIVILDKNKRQAPFVTIVEAHKKHVHELLTRMMHKD